MRFKELEIGDRFEFVTGLAGQWEKRSPRLYVTVNDVPLWKIKRRAVANDEVRLVEKKNNG